MHRIVIFTFITILLAVSPCFPQENGTRYRIEVLVKSSKGRLVKISGGQEEIVRKFPLGTAREKFFRDIPFGKELAIEKIVVNPSWIPTPSMYQEEGMEISKGKRIPEKYRLRTFKSGDPGNPLGRIAYYFQNPLGPPLRFHGTNQNFLTQTDKNGEERGFNVSHGCVRNDLTNLLILTSLFSGKDREEIIDLIHSRKYHELEPRFPLTIKFVPA